MNYKVICQCHSLHVQSQPEVLSSASVPDCDVTVEICEGSITLENSDVFINFTDENLTMSKELKDILDESTVLRCENYVKHYGCPSVGKAVGLRQDHNVVHAVLPKWFSYREDHAEAIVSAVTDSLKLVAHFNASSVSLPVLSCIDKNFPIDCLAKACLSAIHQCCVSSHSMRKIRVVLPIEMAKTFQSELVGGIFHEWIIKNDLEDHQTTTKSVEPVWLWKYDDGKFYAYQTEENTLLNEKRQVGSSCSLNIGRFEYKIDFATMAQTNTRTKKVRQVQCVTGHHVWLFKNDQKKWERFSPSDSMDIEVMYITGIQNSLTINGQRYTYHFSSMLQQNEDDPHSITDIKRIVVAAAATDSKDAQCQQKSQVLIFASPSDRRHAKMKLKSCFAMLKTTKSVDIQQNMVPVLDKRIKLIQREYRVEISSSCTTASSTEGPLKYSITGYRDNVQEATTAVYQLIATTSISTPVQQSFPKPAEWEPQTDPIELKPVTEESREWNKILHHVRKTMPSANLTSIKRIQNEFLWEKYCQHKERMSRKGSERVNEKELFHGSSSTVPEEIYKSEEGFDMRFSRQGMWGQGNYFAESAKYSIAYAYKTSSIDQSLYHQQLLYDSSMIYKENTRQIFLVKVLTGDSFSSPSDKKLRMPPYKQSSSAEKIRYDTVNGMAHGFKVYITYSNDKAYPLYLISF